MKGYKVTDAHRSKRVGVACRNLKELIVKGCKKLNIDESLIPKIIVHLEDGTVIDDEEYFTTLPQNTLLLFTLPGQHIQTVAGIIFDALQKINYDFLKAAEMSSEFFSEDMKSKFRALNDLLVKKENAGKRYKSSKDDDPEWFEGLKEVVRFYLLCLLLHRKLAARNVTSMGNTFSASCSPQQTLN